MEPLQPDDIDITKAAERLMKAAAGISVWWTMVEAERELVGDEAFPDDTVVLHFMGCGASTQVTAKELRELRDASNNLYEVSKKLQELMTGLAANLGGLTGRMTSTGIVNQGSGEQK